VNVGSDNVDLALKLQHSLRTSLLLGIEPRRSIARPRAITRLFLPLNLYTSSDPTSYISYKSQHSNFDIADSGYRNISTMVCSKCQKLQKKTELATPGVKRKNDLYYGSPATSSSSAGDKSKLSATLGTNGIGKVGT